MPTPSRLTASLPVLSPPRPQAAGWRTLVGAVTVLGVCLLGGPPPAAAAPCGPLLEYLYSIAEAGGVNHIKVHWTTNYRIPGFWSTAHADAFIFCAGPPHDPCPSQMPNGPILDGWVAREWHISGYIEPSGFLEFYADGGVRFAGQYGPYPAECSGHGDKFLTVKTENSVETFTFSFDAQGFWP
jgi:hypothetical protein